ncbi:hypothetical protein HFP57_12795 [Parasphingopyxis algicola]|uniref:hypothetical protein n=1 Tax=Parasphingopyxis algicola TaxID=2026624 RepID=UPI00159FFD39|nr:hypothetical protein [Parasphingopyxis algicola]QLC25810.1 hypothetical protein HFP57_12795 [Parasphingopyxis algicola]
MDAPPTQYRVIERGRKLIVLDARTNLPPKQAADLHPASKERRPAEPERARQSEPQAGRQPAKREYPDGFERLADLKFLRRSDRDNEGLHPASIGIGAFAIAMVFALMIGGFTGFLIAAAAIVIAGNVALKHAGKRR